MADETFLRSVPFPVVSDGERNFILHVQPRADSEPEAAAVFTPVPDAMHSHPFVVVPYATWVDIGRPERIEVTMHGLFGSVTAVPQ